MPTLHVHLKKYLYIYRRLMMIVTYYKVHAKSRCENARSYTSSYNRLVKNNFTIIRLCSIIIY